MDYALPDSQHLDVDVGAFSRLFADVTNSYKFLFLLALIEILEKNNFQETHVELTALMGQMLSLAWYPHVYFKLSFGKRDKISRALQKAGTDLIGSEIRAKDRAKLAAELEQISKSNPEIFGDLLRFVPFRLIRPFFAGELKGLADEKINHRVAELSETYFAQRKPLYKISSRPEYVEVHKDWLAYLACNAPIIKGWINWHWLKYMQRCNPSAPNVADKLYYPPLRASLADQTKYWRRFVDNTAARCIYSGRSLQNTNISLDHYIPWSFVSHDLLWNLIPTSREINSAKSDNLADQKYFDPFIAQQHQFLCFNKKTLSEQAFSKLIEPYQRDLRTAEERRLLELDHLQKAYRNNIQPIIALAKANGFVSDWQLKDSALAE